MIADNGSTDGSQDIARRGGARIVDVTERGYGAALRAGISVALGQWIIIGDADDSYDFGSIAPFVEKLQEGCELVMGCRMPWGKGRVMKGAMPWKHRWIGNPALTFLGRLFFKSPANDFHCGLRGLTRDAFQKMNLSTTGMEFASEMVMKASFAKLRMTEVPITLHKDGRSPPAASAKLARRLAAFALHAAALPDVVVLYSGLGAFIWRHRAPISGSCRAAQDRNIRIGIEYARSQQPRDRARDAIDLFRSFRAHLRRDPGISSAQ